MIFEHKITWHFSFAYSYNLLIRDNEVLDLNQQIHIVNPIKQLLYQKGVPQEICSGLPYITMLGNESCKIENYHAIIQFTDHHLVFGSKTGNITIKGSNLCILSYSKRDIVIKGNIHEIYFVR